MCCHNHIYRVPPDTAMICLIFNCIMPGFGTAIQSYYDANGCNCGTYFVGCAQAITAPLIVGWIWAIWHGLEVKKISDAPPGQNAKVIIVNSQDQQALLPNAQPVYAQYQQPMAAPMMAAPMAAPMGAPMMRMGMLKLHLKSAHITRHTGDILERMSPFVRIQIADFEWRSPKKDQGGEQVHWDFACMDYEVFDMAREIVIHVMDHNAPMDNEPIGHAKVRADFFARPGGCEEWIEIHHMGAPAGRVHFRSEFIPN